VGDKLRCSFNYHLGLKHEDRVAAVHDALGKWHDLRKRAMEMVESIERSGSEAR
jgi:hypothetical protein